MKHAVSTGALAVFFCFVVAAPAEPEQDFSGTWVLDKDRSYSNPPGLEQTITIVHAGETLQFDAELKTAQGKQTVHESWILDGAEREFTPSGAAPGSKGKGKASRLPGKRGVLIEEEKAIPAQDGPIIQRTMRKLSLSPDGATLTVDYYIDTPRYQYEAKRVFVKVPAPK